MATHAQHIYLQKGLCQHSHGVCGEADAMQVVGRGGDMAQQDAGESNSKCSEEVSACHGAARKPALLLVVDHLCSKHSNMPCFANMQ